MIAAISPRTNGSREVIASTLSRLTCAVPVKSPSRPPVPGDGVQAAELDPELSENSGAVLYNREEAALPSASESARPPSRRPAPPRDPLRTGRSRYCAQTAGVGTTMVTAVRRAVEELSAHLVTDLAGRMQAAVVRGRQGAPLHPEEGSPSSSSSATTATPPGRACRMTALVHR